MPAARSGKEQRAKKAQEEIAQLKAGNKAYPKELETARNILQTQLS
ncbi:MAG: hypothetical protein ACLSE4_02230 [Clostridium sp.]